ncbi:MAG: 2-C-methyl-D-erythritol 4-phosphate cytidylyltransferase [Oscillospiraceae bacterium]|nr:2-C-methyl-D-erythritol 4-phosphate cytidylyltransferase [Oscillospiraceae bacterium]
MDMALYGRLRDKLLQPFRSAVIVAAGSSTRLGQDKLMLSLGGVPVLARTLLAFESCGLIDEIIVVTREDRLEEFAALRDRYGITKLTQVVVGGATRAGSSLAGVMAASKKATIIAIHDGARPLVTPALIERVLLQAEKRQAAAPVLPLKDTVKERSGDMLVKTPPRETLAAVQTPQAFQASLIRAALTEATEQKLAVTDDCSAVEAIGLPVAVVDGDEENIKITTAMDVLLAEEIIRRRDK